jgi:hypothetical protein
MTRIGVQFGKSKSSKSNPPAVRNLNRGQAMETTPMQRRWRLLLMLVLLLLVAGSFLLPAVHWRVIGWVKGEAFYKGRPTSYWANDFHHWGQTSIGEDQLILLDNDFKQTDYAEESWSWRMKDLLGVETSQEYKWPIILAGDPATIDVLVGLLRDDRQDVRLLALLALGNLGPQAREAVPVLLDALHDPSQSVRANAATALRSIDPEAGAKAGVK